MYKNIEDKRAYYRRWRSSNKEKAILANRAWRAKNPGKSAEDSKKWRELHPGVSYTAKVGDSNYLAKLEINHRYRARKRGSFVGVVIVEDIHNWETRICGICDIFIEGKFDLDHILPLSKGGAHFTGNLQLAHPTCNNQKYNKEGFTLARREDTPTV